MGPYRSGASSEPKRRHLPTWPMTWPPVLVVLSAVWVVAAIIAVHAMAAMTWSDDAAKWASGMVMLDTLITGAAVLRVAIYAEERS